MTNKKTFEDPLSGIDPVMESVFSSHLTFNEDAAPTTVRESVKQQVSDVEFPVLTPDLAGKKINLDIFSKIPVNVSVELGRANVSLKEIFELTEGSIVELERLVGEPLDLVVNGQVIAQGEVVAIDNNYGLRVTHVIAKPQS